MPKYFHCHSAKHRIDYDESAKPNAKQSGETHLFGALAALRQSQRASCRYIFFVVRVVHLFSLSTVESGEASLVSALMTHSSMLSILALAIFALTFNLTGNICVIFLQCGHLRCQ